MNRATVMHDKNFHVLLALVSAAFAWVLWPFWGAVFWGTILAIIFSPVQRWLVAHQPPTASVPPVRQAHPLLRPVLAMSLPRVPRLPFRL